jgi:sugar transferase (PEP-CTERM/EpsH1 system associated)
MTLEPLLFLCHRIPFPPNKGDKIRSYHLLRHLARRYAVHMGTFVDEPADRAHRPALQALAASLHAGDIVPALAKLRSLSGLLRGEALTVPYYRAPTLQRWVDATVRTHGIRKCVVFCSAMAQYVEDLPELRVVVDFCDVDSAKWRQYAVAQRWPSSAIYRREAERLLEHERDVARRAAASVFATPAEAALFQELAPDAWSRVHVVENGVDTDFFSPDAARPTPFAAHEVPIVFTGAMDYWPNVDAACWFASEVLPRVAERQPRVRFYVVGMSPAAAVRSLTRDPRVVVTGRVPDVRPFVQHARLVVAPLRVARGIQNKALEAMALARPVLVSTAAAVGLGSRPGVAFEVADAADGFADKAAALLGDRAGSEALGRRARERILAERDWTGNLAAFDRLLEEQYFEVRRHGLTAEARAEHAR